MSTLNKSDFKLSPLSYPRVVQDDHHHELPRSLRKNGADFRSNRPAPGITRTIEINANQDINESAEEFIKRFRQQQEQPSRMVPAAQRKVAVRGDPIVAGRKLQIERKASIKDINESAEAFIKRFRQQLQIQRLESIENYEEMLARGL